MSLATHRQPPAKPTVDREIVARMADFLTHHTASNGSVNREDLLADFTAAEIDRNFEAAKQRARNAGKARQ